MSSPQKRALNDFQGFPPHPCLLQYTIEETGSDFHTAQLLGPNFPLCGHWQSHQASENAKGCHDSVSEPELLSRLISIWSEGRLSRRLFFWRDCSFSLIKAPHARWSSESSSSGDTDDFSALSGVFSCVLDADPKRVHKFADKVTKGEKCEWKL